MDLENELQKSFTPEQLEEEIEQKIKSFHGFLTREVAIKLIGKEKGLLKQEDKTYKLSEIPKGEKKINFGARIKKIWPIATYSSGKQSRVVEVQDESGSQTLILWNQDVDIAKKLRLNDEILVKGAYEKSGELHLGYSGNVEVTKKAGFADLGSLDENSTVHVRGTIVRIEGYDEFVQVNGIKKGFSFIISNGSERRCVVFQGVDRAEKLQVGDEIVIEGGIVRTGVIEIEDSARILFRRPCEMLIGEVGKIECDGDKLVVEVEGKEIIFDRINGLKFIGVRELADDISLSTVVKLKKSALLNSRIAIKIEQKNDEIVIRD